MDSKRAVDNLKGLNTVKEPSTKRKRLQPKAKISGLEGRTSKVSGDANGSKLSDISLKVDVKKNLTVSSPRQGDEAAHIVELFNKEKKTTEADIMIKATLQQYNTRKNIQGQATAKGSMLLERKFEDYLTQILKEDTQNLRTKRRDAPQILKYTNLHGSLDLVDEIHDSQNKRI